MAKYRADDADCHPSVFQNRIIRVDAAFFGSTLPAEPGETGP